MVLITDQFKDPKSLKFFLCGRNNFGEDFCKKVLQDHGLHYSYSTIDQQTVILVDVQILNDYWCDRLKRFSNTNAIVDITWISILSRSKIFIPFQDFIISDHLFKHKQRCNPHEIILSDNKYVHRKHRQQSETISGSSIPNVIDQSTYPNDNMISSDYPATSYSTQSVSLEPTPADDQAESGEQYLATDGSSVSGSESESKLDGTDTGQNVDTEQTGKKDVGFTRLNPNFVSDFFSKSRLSFLGTFRSRHAGDEFIRPFVVFQNYESKCRESVVPPQLILHVDFNAFFAEISIVTHPHYAGLRSKPVAIAHSDGVNSTSTVSSVNYVAKDYGIKKGSSVARAYELCPEIVILPYNLALASSTFDFLLSLVLPLTPYIQIKSCDELLFQLVGEQVGYFAYIAKAIHDTVYLQCNCHLTIGVGEGEVYAKMSTTRCKKDGVQSVLYFPEQARVERYLEELDCQDGTMLIKPFEFTLNLEDRINRMQEFFASLALSDLPGVGRKLAQKFQAAEITSVRDLIENKNRIESIGIPQSSAQQLISICEGRAYGAKPNRGSREKDPRACSVKITWGVRMRDDDDVIWFLDELISNLFDRTPTDTHFAGSALLKLYIRNPDAPIVPSKFGGRGDCYILSASCMLARRKMNLVDVKQRLHQIWLDRLRPFYVARDLRGVHLIFSNLTPLQDGVCTSLSQFINTDMDGSGQGRIVTPAVSSETRYTDPAGTLSDKRIESSKTCDQASAVSELSVTDYHNEFVTQLKKTTRGIGISQYFTMSSSAPGTQCESALSSGIDLQIPAVSSSVRNAYSGCVRPHQMQLAQVFTVTSDSQTTESDVALVSVDLGYSNNLQHEFIPSERRSAAAVASSGVPRATVRHRVLRNTHLNHWISSQPEVIEISESSDDSH